jgi:hypothetical protein
MTDPKEIAAGLKPCDGPLGGPRELLLSEPGKGFVWYDHCLTLVDLGLFRMEGITGFSFTPLGLAVRAELEKEERK